MFLEYGKWLWYIILEVINIIMCSSKKEKICKEWLLCVCRNVVFFVDVKLLKYWEDVKDDMNGIYNKVFWCGVWMV